MLPAPKNTSILEVKSKSRIGLFSTITKEDLYQNLSKHVIGMTQYYVHNFQEQTSPKFVSTYDITSCVVILLKNLDDNKICSSFGMAHVNMVNIFFRDKGKENLKSFISDFELIGGNLKSASVQLFGGLIVDKNNVREKIASILCEIAKEKGIENFKIKTPERFKINASIDSYRHGNVQLMTITCDQLGTYTRKVTIEHGKMVSQDLYPADFPLLSDKNLKEIVPVEKTEYDRLKEKTNSFHIEINKLRHCNLNPPSEKYINKIQEIKARYCTFEKSQFSSRHAIEKDQNKDLKQFTQTSNSSSNSSDMISLKTLPSTSFVKSTLTAFSQLSMFSSPLASPITMVQEDEKKEDDKAYVNLSH